MRELLLRKDWINLIAVLSLAIIPFFAIGSKGTKETGARQIAAVQSLELPAE